jgi:hypothetical protein
MTARAETVQLADERTILGAYAMLQRGLPDFFDTEGPDAHTIDDAMMDDSGEPDPEDADFLGRPTRALDGLLWRPLLGDVRHEVSGNEISHAPRFPARAKS